MRRFLCLIALNLHSFLAAAARVDWYSENLFQDGVHASSSQSRIRLLPRAEFGPFAQLGADLFSTGGSQSSTRFYGAPGIRWRIPGLELQFQARAVWRGSENGWAGDARVLGVADRFDSLRIGEILHTDSELYSEIVCSSLDAGNWIGAFYWRGAIRTQFDSRNSARLFFEPFVTRDTLGIELNNRVDLRIGIRYQLVEPHLSTSFWLAYVRSRYLGSLPDTEGVRLMLVLGGDG